MRPQGFIILASALLLLGCAKADGETVTLHISGVRGDEGGCRAIIGGTSFDPQDQEAMEAALTPYAKAKANIRTVGDQNVPYRCIGGLIYTMRRQGHTKIGFISGAPEAGEK